MERRPSRHRPARPVRAYLDKGGASRSLGSEEELFTVDLAQALELFRQPPTRGRRANASPGRELGSTPEGKAVSVRSGRFGPYVTDGEVNASLRTADDPEKIDLDRALELLAARKERLAHTTTTVRRSRPDKATGSKKPAKKTASKNPRRRQQKSKQQEEAWMFGA